MFLASPSMSLRRSQQLLLEYVCVPYTALNLACEKGPHRVQSTGRNGDVEAPKIRSAVSYLQVPLSQLVDLSRDLLGLNAAEVVKHIDLRERMLQEVVTAT